MLRVGLVGAGPWATQVHAPVLAAGPETRLDAVWARDPNAAASLAGAHAAFACQSFEELVERVECVAFAVPPHVQARLAPIAAEAGRHLLLEKPLAADLSGAEQIAAVVRTARVASIVLLTQRFSSPVREFLQLHGGRAEGARVEHLTAAFVTGVFAQSPWRHEGGVVLDVGPHVLDLLLAVMGPVADVRVEIDDDRVVTIDLTHGSGRTSQAVLSAHWAGEASRYVEVVRPEGPRRIPLTPSLPDVAANLRSDLVRAVRSGVPHQCDADRGLEVQRLVDRVLQLM